MHRTMTRRKMNSVTLGHEFRVVRYPEDRTISYYIHWTFKHLRTFVLFKVVHVDIKHTRQSETSIFHLPACGLRNTTLNFALIKQ